LGRDYSRAFGGVETGESPRIHNPFERVYIRAVSEPDGRDPPTRIVEKPAAAPNAAADAPEAGQTPFRALLAAALTHNDAALGLACAYAELQPAQRSELLDAVIADARAEELSLKPLLGPLCAVESDPALSARLRGMLEAHGVALDMRPAEKTEPPRILLTGDAGCGAALLVRPLTGDQLDVLELRWNIAGAVLHAARKRIAPLELTLLATTLHEAAKRDARATLTEIEEVPLDLAAEVVAHALWRHRRAHGVLPVELSDFADLIGPQASRAAL
jgi:hypothetical protein